MDNYEEIPKYRKKKSSKSKSENKSNHKHQYKACLLVDDNNRPHKAEYCEICGKINNIQFFETIQSDNAAARLMTTDEIFQKYKDIVQFRIKDMRNKYVLINTQNKDGEKFFRSMTDEELRVYNNTLKSDSQKTEIQLFNVE